MYEGPIFVCVSGKLNNLIKSLQHTELLFVGALTSNYLVRFSVPAEKENVLRE